MMNRSGSRFLFVCILCCCAWTALLPDTLEMRDGRKLRGRVVRQNARTVFFQHQDGTTAALPKNTVRRILYDTLPDPAEAERKRAGEQKKLQAERKKQEAARREAAARKVAEEKRKEEAEERRQTALKKELELERERLTQAAAEAERKRVEQEKASAAARAKAAEEERRQAAAARADAAERERLAREAEERRIADEKFAAEEKQLIQEVEAATKAAEKKEIVAKAPEGPKQPEPDRARPDTAARDGSSASAWFLEAGLTAGEYTPDLEARFLADKFLNVLFNTGGIGFNTAWEDKTFRDLVPALRYETGRWLFGGEIASATIRPHYYGLVKAGAITLANATYEPYELESVEGVISRDQVSLYGGYEIIKSEPFSCYGLGGLRSIETEALLSSRKFGGSKISNYVPAVNATIAGNVSELSRVQALHHSEAAGPQLGVLGRYRLDRWQVDLGAAFYSLEGDTRTRALEAKLSEARATVSVGSFSQNFSGSSGELVYREEAGNLAITGREFTTGLSYRLGPTRRLFLRATRSIATFADSRVMVWRLNTNPAANPYTQELNGETIYTRDLKFTYPGSAHQENIRALTFGIEQEI